MPRPIHPAWEPVVGAPALHVASRGSLVRRVEVVAHASSGYMVVLAIGRRGAPVRLTVKRDNLRPVQPDLLSGLCA